MDREVTTKDILETLKQHYSHSEEWVYFEELRCGTGYGGKAPDSERRIDFWAINCWSSKDRSKHAYEIKVSRSDFLREIKDPVKRRAALMASNVFYFVTPPGLLKKTEIPYECGLVEVHEGVNGKLRLKTIIQAPWRDTVVPTWAFMAAVCRRVRDFHKLNDFGLPLERDELQTVGIGLNKWQEQCLEDREKSTCPIERNTLLNEIEISERVHKRVEEILEVRNYED